MGAARAGVPDLLAGLLRDRVDLAAVGAEVELAVGEREAALDGAVGLEAPLLGALVGAALYGNIYYQRQYHQEYGKSPGAFFKEITCFLHTHQLRRA